MSDRQINLFARRLAKNFAWLSSCIQEFDVTDIGEQYSLSHIFKTDKTFSTTKDLTISKENSQNSQNKISQESKIQTMKEKARKASEKIQR